MLETGTTVGWGGALLWLGGIAGGAFLISWVLTDLLHVRRAAYVGALTLLTGALTAGYVVWSGSGARFWVDGWAWGVVAAVVAGTLLALMVSRAPGAPSRGWMGARSSLWEGFVYGSAEGLLLSVLPVVATWQLLSVLGWTGGWRGMAAVTASALVIAVHHLGYREDRGQRIVSPIIACTVLSIAYLLTASPIAAMGGHIVLHLAMLRRGMELPPHARPGPVPPAQEKEARVMEMAT